MKLEGTRREESLNRSCCWRVSVFLCWHHRCHSPLFFSALLLSMLLLRRRSSLSLCVVSPCVCLSFVFLINVSFQIIS